MTIKKLTVAAAIAVGIATCSLNQAMAACPCAIPETPAPCAEPLPVVTGPACPCETVNQTHATNARKLCLIAIVKNLIHAQIRATNHAIHVKNLKNQTADVLTKSVVTNRQNLHVQFALKQANLTEKT